jgi:hypothetical protein
MIESLTKVLSHFPGAANRARCTAHIVNLVAKIILRQFDAKKKPKGTQKRSENANDNANKNTNEDPMDSMEPEKDDDDENIATLAEGLEREEQEAGDDENDDMGENNIVADLDEIEEVMKEEVLEVTKKVKPIQRVLFKVRLISLNSFLYDIILYPFFTLLMFLSLFL